jgi:hypothetical protein
MGCGAAGAKIDNYELIGEFEETHEWFNSEIFEFLWLRAEQDKTQAQAAVGHH